MKNGKIKIPYLPGMVFENPEREDFKKSQTFVITAKTMLEKENRNFGLFPSDTLNSYTKPLDFGKKKHEVDTLKMSKNSFVVNNEKKVENLKVLRFYAYFKQEMDQSPKETFTFRKTELLYFLEDNTIQIIEPVVPNSGMMQGTFLRRQKVPLSSEEFLSFHHFDIGNILPIFAREFHIYDCDECTRKWYESQSMMLRDSEEPPVDEFTIMQQNKNKKIIDPNIKEYKQYCEVRLGGGHSNKGLKKYLNNDGKVLSFDAIWNDTSFAGGINEYKINYFLANDTVEIKEIHKPNNGKRPFPLLLKKSRLPKNFKMTHCPGMLNEKEIYYNDRDFILGNTIECYNRTFELLDCDQFTKDYFQEKYGIVQKRVNKYFEEKIMKTERKIPPHNGFGSEEDSLGNCFNLIPKPPKIDLEKKFIYNRVILRFICRMISKNEIDSSKKFVLSFYCGDDSIMIYLQPERNSGIQGGKFLEKRKYKNDLTQKYYTTNDLFMGQILNINNYKFQIISSDEYTFNFMFQRPDLFPLCDPEAIFDVLRERFHSWGSFEDFVNAFKQNYEEDYIHFDTLHKILEDLGIYNTLQETFTIFYLCDSKENENICIEELLEVIHNKFYE
jgi:hypothetical protein